MEIVEDLLSRINGQTLPGIIFFAVCIICFMGWLGYNPLDLFRSKNNSNGKSTTKSDTPKQTTTSTSTTTTTTTNTTSDSK